MMGPKFQMQDHDFVARRARLSPERLIALDQAQRSLASRFASHCSPPASDSLAAFLLPFVEADLTQDQIVRIVGKLPEDFPLDHREIYFDFRLSRWCKHIEPPTITQCLDEYMESAETPEQGLAYLTDVWNNFLRRNSASGRSSG